MSGAPLPARLDGYVKLVPVDDRISQKELLLKAVRRCSEHGAAFRTAATTDALLIINLGNGETDLRNRTDRADGNTLP